LEIVDEQDKQRMYLFFIIIFLKKRKKLIKRLLKSPTTLAMKNAILNMKFFTEENDEETINPMKDDTVFHTFTK